MFRNGPGTAFAVRADLCCQSIVIAVFPVSVRNSQTPPVVVFGTSTEPTSLSAKKILSDSRLPVTSPVSVFKWSSLGIAGGKLYMACAPFNRNLVCGGHVIQGDAADASG